MGRIEKPWGYEEHVLSTQVDVGDKVGMLGIRRLVIDADEMTSYSYHEEQSDIIYLEEGNAQIRKEGGIQELEKGNAIVIRSNEKHQIQNIDTQVAKILEISFPYKPEDLHRVEDPYAEARDDDEQEE
ncbi:cupin domain-containing protein [Candidatus Nanohaloarchaea archaeon]|nr:cupin domain-containing protein [Candidatus Nanohaloarchaea archaeon]